VGHEPRHRGAVPVLLARREEDAIAGTNDLDRPAAPLAEADAFEDVTVWPFGWVCQAVRAPGVKWTLLALSRESSEGAATVSM
jgi:hypothetical protein